MTPQANDLFAMIEKPAGDLRRALAEGVDTNPTSSMGRTPLSLAAGRGLKEHVALLLEAGADPNLSDLAGMTPLMHAAIGQHASVIEILLAKGANPNLADCAGRTALHHSKVRPVDFPIAKGRHATLFLPRIFGSASHRILRRATRSSER